VMAQGGMVAIDCSRRAAEKAHGPAVAAGYTDDQVTRYLLVRKNPLLWRWLLQREAEQVRFDDWMPTQLTLPGVAERICDGIVRLANLEQGGTLFAGVLEIQTR